MRFPTVVIPRRSPLRVLHDGAHAHTPLRDAGSRRSALVVYALCCVLMLVLLPLGGPIEWAEIGPAIALQALDGLVLAVGARLPSDRFPAIGVAGVIA